MKSITLQIAPCKARQIYRTATPELRAILDGSAPKGFFEQNVMDRVKSYEDACRELGIQPMDEHGLLCVGFRQDEIDRRKLETITLALNGGEYPDWQNPDQSKWMPWFSFSAPSGFAFGGTDDWCSDACAGSASRLCFLSEEHARYAGQMFPEIYRSIIDNKPSK